jgi:hypothetical protein
MPDIAWSALESHVNILSSWHRVHEFVQVRRRASQVHTCLRELEWLGVHTHVYWYPTFLYHPLDTLFMCSYMCIYVDPMYIKD